MQASNYVVTICSSLALYYYYYHHRLILTHVNECMDDEPGMFIL